MNITIIGTAFPYRGGIAAFNERLAKQFVDEGHNVEIYTFTLQYPNFLFPGKTQYSDSTAPENLKIARKINSINPVNWIKIGNEIKKKKPDLVVIPYWMSFMAPCLGTIAKQIRINRYSKIVGLVHNMLPHEPSVLDKIFPPCYVKNVGAFVSLSKSVLLDINKFDKQNKPKRYSPHPIYDNFGDLNPKGIALDFLKLDNSFRYILFFGFIREYKGLDLLLEAMADEHIKKMNIKLIVAGEFYNNKEIYTKIVEENNIQEQIVWRTDFIPDDEVKYYFSACDLVVQPYKSATQSGVTQIAYHFEKPMIVTNVGGLAEIVPNGKCGYVVEPDPKEIAEKIVTFFEENPDFSVNIKKEKEKYGWDKMTEALISILK